MKIGILTFWRSNDNYGQVLQCYALQKYLSDNGYEPFLIRYDHTNAPIRRNKKKVFLKIILIYPLINKIFDIVKNRKNKSFKKAIELKNRQRRFDDFKSKYINKTEIVYKSLNELRRNPPPADCYIVGSDQVWAKLLDNNENETYFLNFGSEKTLRVAYAASFAMKSYPTSLEDPLKKQLGRFDHISVRESNGVDICRKVGFDAIEAVDPTVLLTNKSYCNLISKTSLVPGPYMFVYHLNVATSAEMYWDEFLELNKLSNMGIVAAASSGYIPGREILGQAKYIYPSIEEWLSLIYHSEYVVTTSFHGVVFCILMNKNFVFIPLKGKHSTGNVRVENFLNKIGLDFKIAWVNENAEKCLKMQIDWVEVNKKVGYLRKQSINYLKNCLYFKNKND
ncbi:polysaccharide pyruvyl transferase family protein [Arundinibacter roseus]|uniref:Polysaccharide pyruvyl transferase family protein n=1 Tax=Arundinibacter roseus TaxID=2070510 RepID=A0A4R4KB34_9BACT|nr:polysaccharide pyruvyl transferase family protein [Arundinibacter roseus]TDB63379.1 polysaccharide pyruvyl transferase family protein [Arundinibacter roseus]